MSREPMLYIKVIYRHLIFKILAGLVILWFTFAYLMLNPLAIRLVPVFAEHQLASHATVQKVSLDPWKLILTITKFKLTTLDNTPLMGFDTLVIDIDANGLWKRAWKVKQIALIKPYAQIQITKDGKLNWSALIDKLNEKPSPPDQPLPRVIIGHISVTNGTVDYENMHQAEPLEASLKPLEFELDGFSTLPEDRGDYLIAAKLPYQGGTLKWKGSVGVNPVNSQGSLSLAGLELTKLAAFVNSQALPTEIKHGTLSTELQYDFSLINQKPQLKLADLKLTLDALSAFSRQSEQIDVHHAEFSLSSLELKQVSPLALAFGKTQVDLDTIESQKESNRLVIASAQMSLPAMDIQQGAQLQVNFQNMGLEVHDIKLSTHNQPLLELPKLNVNGIHHNAANHHLDIEQVLLANAQVSATTAPDGGLDWQQLAASDKKMETGSTPPTKAHAQQNQPSFNSSSAESQSLPSTPALQLKISAIDLSHWRLNYLNRSLKHPIAATMADFNLHFAIDNLEGLVLKNITATGNQLTALSEKKPIAQLGKISLNQGNVSLDHQKISIGSIQLSGFNTSLIRQTDHRLNWQSLLEPVNISKQEMDDHPPFAKRISGKTHVQSIPTSSLWQLALNQLQLQHANIHIEDQTTPNPVLLDITDVEAGLQNITLDSSRPLPLRAGLKIKQGGQINVDGRLSLAPLQADLQLSLQNLSLTPFSPYIQQVAMITLNDGTFSLAGKLQQKTPTSIRFAGGFSVEHLNLLEESSKQTFLGWSKLQANGLNFSVAPEQLKIATLQLEQPQGKFIIHEDKSLNITRILRKGPESNSNTAVADPSKTPINAAKAVSQPESLSSQETTSSFPVTIDSLNIQNAKLEFADLSLQPQFGTNIHSLSGFVNGISNDPNAIAQVELDGKVDQYGAASIRGSLQPFKTTNFTDVKMAFSNLEMQNLTPYSGKFAGRKIESGKLSVDLEYKIKQRQLAGTNKFVINKLKLGAKVDSKEAANLPLDLAIAILEDSDGVIDLDLPISGNLDDPKFSYGSIIWKAFTNVISKIVTAPFRALGKLFGGSEKLEAILFEPGTSDISPPELEKLNAVSTALSKRQQLKLGILPSYDVAIDTRAIQELKLRQIVAQEIGVKLESGQRPGPIDLNNTKVQSVVQTLFDKLNQKSLLKRLASKFDKPPAGYYQEAQEKLTSSMVVNSDELQALAMARGHAIEQVLVSAGVPQDRIGIVTVEAMQAGNQGVATKLSLDVIKH